MRNVAASVIFARYRLPWTYMFELPLTDAGIQARDDFMRSAYAEVGAQDRASAQAATDEAYQELLSLENWNFSRTMFPLASAEELEGICLAPWQDDFGDWSSAVMHAHDESTDDIDRNSIRCMVLLRAWRLLDVHTAVRWTLNGAVHAQAAATTYHFGPRGS